MNVFNNKKYTNWYFAIISNAKIRVTTEYTEIHHIVPMCFYIKNRSKGLRPGWLAGNPNDPRNLVSLTPREHFVCHWLLTKMVDDTVARIKMEHALSSFRRSLKMNGLLLSATEYQRLKLAYVASHKGRERKPSPLKGRKQLGPVKYWWTNGISEIKSEIAPDQSWVGGRVHSPLKGRSNTSARGLIWWNDGKSERMSDTCPAHGWRQGRISHQHGNSGRRGKSYGPHSDLTKEKISIANKGKVRSSETRAKMSSDRKGRPSPTKGCKIWNDGMIEIRVTYTPKGPDWVRGRLRYKRTR